MQPQKKTILNTQRRTLADCQRCPKRPAVLVLDNIRSAHNVGAAFRLSDAFLLSHIYLCGITPTPPHPQIQKTSLGAEQAIPWTYERDTLLLLQRLKQEGYSLLAIEQATPSIPLQHFKREEIPPPYAFIFGHELFGISESILHYVDLCLEIPQHGTKLSMNVAVCMGIVVWEVFKDTPAP